MKSGAQTSPTFLVRAWPIRWPALQVPRMPNNESGNIAQRGVASCRSLRRPGESRVGKIAAQDDVDPLRFAAGFQTLAWLDKEWEGRRQEDNGPDAELFHWPASLLVKDTSLNVNRPVRKRGPVTARPRPDLAQDPPPTSNRDTYRFQASLIGQGR